MTDGPFTILDDGRAARVVARVADGRVRVPGPELEAALGWTVTPDGLCRDGACFLVPAGSPLATEEGIDLAELAALAERPLALDLDERAAYLGVPARDRADALASLEAPDFALPDLDGRVHALSEQRGQKVLLVAYASW